MVIVADAGNTNVVIAGIEKGNVLFVRRLETHGELLNDQGQEGLAAMLMTSISSGINIEGSILSSVVPECIAPLSRLLRELSGREPLICGPELDMGISYPSYKGNPPGMDRLVDSLMAREGYGAPVMVFDLGSCTTMSAVDSEGHFAGGSISCGVQMMLDAMSEKTAVLPKLYAGKGKPADNSPMSESISVRHVSANEQTCPAGGSLCQNSERQKPTLIDEEENSPSLIYKGSVLGTNAASCMFNGAIIGTAAMIDGLAARLEEEWRQDEIPLVLTGGFSSLVKDWMRHPVIHDPFLLLKGLEYVFRRNCDCSA